MQVRIGANPDYTLHSPGLVFSYKLRYIVGMRNFYKNTGSGVIDV